MQEKLLINFLKYYPKDKNKIWGVRFYFFRDDFRRKKQVLKPKYTSIDFLIENKNVILIDDVLYTGRSIRSSLDSIVTFGRPKKIELLVLINRRFSRELPIEPKYVGKSVDVINFERVLVDWNSRNVLLLISNMYELSVKHMLGIKGLTPNDINLIFDVAKNFKEVISRPIKKVPTLRDITIANLFFENSTRTKLSFELAEKRLSADVLNFSSSNSSLSKGESLIDTVNNILAMKVDMVVIRHPDPGVAYFLSKNVDSVIINAGDGAHEHPTQALLDSYSINEKLGTIKGKNILIVGDIKHSRVALSNIFCLQKMGANVRVCAPPTLVPKNINDLNVEVSYNLEESLNWCDVANVLRIQVRETKFKILHH